MRTPPNGYAGSGLVRAWEAVSCVRLPTGTQVQASIGLGEPYAADASRRVRVGRPHWSAGGRRLRQNSCTDMLITGIDEIIAELSKGMTLQAGTIIATGTPKGVGMGFDPPRWLKPGDVVECEIEKIGTLRNVVA